MFNLFGNIQEILKIILAIAIIVLIIFTIRKVPGGKYLLVVIIYVAVVASGVFCGYASHQYFNAKGGVVGLLDEITNQNKVIQNEYEFDFKKLSLVLSEGDTYSAHLIFENQDDKSISAINKVIYVNEQPTTLINRNASFITAEYGYTFYDENLKIICSDYLTIKFSFNSKYSECKISTQGGSEAAKQWTNFLQKNHFKVTLVEETFTFDDALVIDKAKNNLIKYYINGELYETQIYTINEETTLINYEVEEGYLFFGWFDTPPQGDLRTLSTKSTISSEEAVEISLYGRYIKKDAINEPGFSDSTINFNIEIDSSVQSSVYGAIILDYYDIDLGYDRRLTYTLREGAYTITGLKYANYTLTFMGLKGLDKVPAITITTSYKSNSTYNLKLNYNAPDGLYDIAIT